MEKSILIFDDDEDILRICTYILQSHGWTVNSYTNVVDVVEKAAAVNPSVIIMDNWIPEEGGIYATHQLKASVLQHIPVVYFTANSSVKELAAKAGADSYLAKPFEIAELIGVADHALTLKK